MNDRVQIRSRLVELTVLSVLETVRSVAKLKKSSIFQVS